MNIVRYAGPDGIRIGIQDETGTRALPVPSIAELLALPLDRIRAAVSAA